MRASAHPLAPLSLAADELAGRRAEKCDREKQPENLRDPDSLPSAGLERLSHGGNDCNVGGTTLTQAVRLLLRCAAEPNRKSRALSAAVEAHVMFDLEATIDTGGSVQQQKKSSTADGLPKVADDSQCVSVGESAHWRAVHLQQHVAAAGKPPGVTNHRLRNCVSDVGELSQLSAASHLNYRGQLPGTTPRHASPSLRLGCKRSCVSVALKRKVLVLMLRRLEPTHPVRSNLFVRVYRSQLSSAHLSASPALLRGDISKGSPWKRKNIPGPPLNRAVIRAFPHRSPASSSPLHALGSPSPFQSHLCKPENVVRMLYCQTKRPPMYLVLDTYRPGNLLHFLWTLQNDYLISEHRLVHGDVAAMNILSGPGFLARCLGWV
ncbi:hypothetical protein FQN60_002242 [Etheostoma spectabile]|uniref:Uncharacterized protein n=1 Tax=Etheostoma spectabile TaxID=54343 RepID=A0A5J5DC15_9PERO|nr:hypothetical protein FQN60_002242 [Etheostoma spectabile]